MKEVFYGVRKVIFVVICAPDEFPGKTVFFERFPS
jgi:hypothetical protein